MHYSIYWPRITGRQAATIHAALRYWQTADIHTRILFEHVATNERQLEPLNGEEIDDLCDRLSPNPKGA